MLDLYAPATSFHRQAMCSSKARYESKRDAMTAKNSAERRRHNNPGHLKAYPCPYCNGWHLAKQERE